MKRVTDQAPGSEGAWTMPSLNSISRPGWPVTAAAWELQLRSHHSRLHRPRSQPAGSRRAPMRSRAPCTPCGPPVTGLQCRTSGGEGAAGGSGSWGGEAAGSGHAGPSSISGLKGWRVPVAWRGQRPQQRGQLLVLHTRARSGQDLRWFRSDVVCCWPASCLGSQASSLQ